ncbi:MAG: Ig-like domain-containing protein, partial [Oscillospiraceae bacterium]|nr:Ig-like domain-containing protein [Oscillospiraceae bacterium]
MRITYLKEDEKMIRKNGMKAVAILICMSMIFTIAFPYGTVFASEIQGDSHDKEDEISQSESLGLVDDGVVEEVTDNLNEPNPDELVVDDIDNKEDNPVDLDEGYDPEYVDELHLEDTAFGQANVQDTNNDSEQINEDYQINDNDSKDLPEEKSEMAALDDSSSYDETDEIIGEESSNDPEIDVIGDPHKMVSGSYGSIVANGTIDDSKSWVLYTNGILEISGTGEISSSSSWSDYASSIECVVINEGITGLQSWCKFKNLSNLKSVFIPLSLTDIAGKNRPDNPFYECNSNCIIFCAADSQPSGWLQFWNLYKYSGWPNGAGADDYRLKVVYSSSSSDACYWPFADLDVANLTVPDGVSRVYENAVKDKSAVSQIAFQGHITKVDRNAISGCTNLETISFEKGVSYISREAFSNCSSLSSITFCGDAPVFESNAFSGLTVIAYYPAANWSSWKNCFADYGGNVTWVPTADILVESISVTAEADTVIKNQSIALECHIYPENADAHEVMWEAVSGTGTASITEEGVLTGTAVGNVFVRAIAVDGSSIYGEKEVNILPVLAESVEIDSSSDEVSRIGTLQLGVTVLPVDTDNKDVVWSIVEGSQFASISEDGIITGKAIGSCVVRATSKDGGEAFGEKTITVTPVYVDSVSVEGSKTIVRENESIQMAAVKTPDNADDTSVLWEIINKTGEATVSETGLLTGVSPGMVEVRATAKDRLEIYGKADIRVIPENTYVVTYTDGVDGEFIFEDQTYISCEYGTDTPRFVGDPTREGYIFTGWDKEIPAVVLDDYTFTATWEKETYAYAVLT